MTRDPRYDILFEPVQIGPVTAKNRFYQVPHCNGLGHQFPRAEAAMRGMKAEGGWAVVSTQEVHIHPSSDVSPFLEGRLWDQGDMTRMALMVDAVHEHDSLAAVEITHNGHHGNNRHSRLPSMAVSEMIVNTYDPSQTYAMTRKDIANVRRWHRQAAIHARDTGFDIVYVYAGHDLSLPFHFLSRNRNTRTDEYGGSLQNRVRFLKEILEDTKDAIGDQCGVAIRFAVDELMGNRGISCDNEGKEVVEMLAELPDLWYVNVSDWQHDSQTSRFSEEGFQETYTAFVKQVTSKPVVGVGRFTSPDTMISQIKRGVLDMIGAARPSIADPFLPTIIEQGRIDDIRECIGCNICVSSDMTIMPIRCTQNPTMAEEFRRQWHPEQIKAAKSEDSVLIIGAGPSGLEAAMSLGRRGYNVIVAEAEAEAGGRVLRESKLPGLGAWKRVVDYRLGQIAKLESVSIHLQSKLDLDLVSELSTEFGIQHIVCAAGAKWDVAGMGRQHQSAIASDGTVPVYTPDDIMSGLSLSGKAVVYDDDHYYMGGVIAEVLVKQGVDVTLVTPASDVSTWTVNTLEQKYIERHLNQLGVKLIEKHQITKLANSQITISHIANQVHSKIEVDAVIMVTARRAQHELFFELENALNSAALPSIKSVKRIGDCVAPSTIAAAVYAGHLFAQEFDEGIDIDQVPYRREYVQID